MSRILHLHKQEQFLKDHGGCMLGHDSFVMEQLDEEDPPSTKELQELECLADAQDIAQLAAVLDLPSFSQMVNDPSLWANVNFSAGGIAEPAGGSLLNS